MRTVTAHPRATGTPTADPELSIDRKKILRVLDELELTHHDTTDRDGLAEHIRRALTTRQLDVDALCEVLDALGLGVSGARLLRTAAARIYAALRGLPDSVVDSVLAPAEQARERYEDLLRHLDAGHLLSLDESRLLTRMVFELSVAVGAGRALSASGLDPDPHGVFTRVASLWCEALGETGWNGIDPTRGLL